MKSFRAYTPKKKVGGGRGCWRRRTRRCWFRSEVGEGERARVGLGKRLEEEKEEGVGLGRRLKEEEVQVSGRG
ncbi:hypothetical protein KSS87_018429 [Heliosperma pusillum]|nr:hypothetical protein KSS87_018429 [Heliosperma pusillum]